MPAIRARADQVAELLSKRFHSGSLWCLLHESGCQTTCERRSFGSGSKFRSCQSRWWRSIQESPRLQDSSPGSSSWPYVWQSELDTPTWSYKLSNHSWLQGKCTLALVVYIELWLTVTVARRPSGTLATIIPIRKMTASNHPSKNQGRQRSGHQEDSYTRWWCGWSARSL